MKALLGFLATFLGLLLVTSAALALDLFKRGDFVLPRTVIGNIDLSGLSRPHVRDILREQITTFVQQPVRLAARGEVKEVSLNDMGIVLNESEILERIPFARNMSNGEIILWSIAGKRVLPGVEVHRSDLLRLIDEQFPNIPRVKNASFERQGKTFRIVEAQNGVAPNVEPLLTQLKQDISFLEHRPLIVEFEDVTPSVLTADLEKYREDIEKALPQKISLVLENSRWDVNFSEHPEWIAFDRKPYSVSEGELMFSMKWDPVAFSQFLNDKLASTIEQAPDSIRIWKDDQGKVQFEGRANEGRAIERERLLTLVNFAMSNKTQEVEIPMVVVPPQMEIAEDLQELGIKELIAVGYTRFAGSPANRMHNIGVGVARFNGRIIPPGETFSFNDNLGPVDASTGYRKELVIKPEGTIPEYGGGLCQVSTTLYRAVLFAGLPLVERWPHSYAVTYYSQVLGHGLDATIYPPARDLKFTNDTPGSILIFSYVEGRTAAYFKFFGTSDGRKVEMEGPYIANKRGPPADPILVPDSTLAPGQKKQVEKPHGGFDATWYRHLTKDGKTTKEEIFSRYRAVPAKYLVGGEVTPEGENKALLESTNPFE